MRKGASKVKPAPKAKPQLVSRGVALQMKAKQPIVDTLERLSAEKASERTAEQAFVKGPLLLSRFLLDNLLYTSMFLCWNPCGHNEMRLMR
jgi:hypothetical protein